MAHDVFLSYRSEDKAQADRLCSSLERNGIHCWIAPRNIPIGTEWPTAIVEAIAACKVFVIVLSSNSKNAKQISREAELADKQGNQIVTFRIEDVEPPPGLSYFLGNIQWLDAFGGQFDAAAAHVAQLVKTAPEPDPPTKPALPVRLPPEKKSGWVLPVSAGALCLLGVGIWAATRHPNSVPSESSGTTHMSPADPMLAAKSVADRFLNERETGNLNSAWAEFTAEAQSQINRAGWLKAQQELRESGRVTSRFDGCTPSGAGFSCKYTLLHNGGSPQSNEMWLVRNQQGGWSIARSELGRPPKS